MLTTFDLPSVQQFATHRDLRRSQRHEEGSCCIDLDELLGRHVTTCEELRGSVDHWAREVFAGRIAFDPEVERVFKDELQRTLSEARPLAEHGRAVETDCFSLEQLAALEDCVAHFTFLLTNWISPQRSTAPAPRVSLGEAIDQQIRERIATLPPLPTDWQPKDCRQARLFGRRSTP